MDRGSAYALAEGKPVNQGADLEPLVRGAAGMVAGVVAPPKSVGAALIAKLRSILPGGQPYQKELDDYNAAATPPTYSVTDGAPMPGDDRTGFDAARRFADTDQGRDRMLQMGSMAAPLVIHGSPNYFAGKPGLKHIGKGEGAQIRGDGIYTSVPENLDGIYDRYVRNLRLRDGKPLTEFVPMYETGKVTGTKRMPDGKTVQTTGGKEFENQLKQISRNVERDPTLEPDELSETVRSALLGRTTANARTAIADRNKFDSSNFQVSDPRGRARMMINALRQARDVADFQMRPGGSLHAWDVPNSGILKQWQTVVEAPADFGEMLAALPHPAADRIQTVLEGRQGRFDAQELMRKQGLLTDEDGLARIAGKPGVRPLVEDPSKASLEELLKLLRPYSHFDEPFLKDMGNHGAMTPQEIRRSLVKGGFNTLEYMGEEGSYGYNPVQNYVLMNPSKTKDLGTFRTPGALRDSGVLDSSKVQREMAARLRERNDKGWGY